MPENVDVLDGSRNPHLPPHLASATSWLPRERGKEREETQEESCLAFGYLRGTHERALAIELRLRNGNRDYFSYSHLASWRYNPSVGLLLKFTDDLVTLVLIRGSNLDALVKQSVNLTDRGFQRHRIVYVREMDEDELWKAGTGSRLLTKSTSWSLRLSRSCRRGWKRTPRPSCGRRGECDVVGLHKKTSRSRSGIECGGVLGFPRTVHTFADDTERIT